MRQFRPGQLYSRRFYFLKIKYGASSRGIAVKIEKASDRAGRLIVRIVPSGSGAARTATKCLGTWSGTVGHEDAGRGY